MGALKCKDAINGRIKCENNPRAERNLEVGLHTPERKQYKTELIEIKNK